MNLGSMPPMPAKCPYCDDGCDRCDGGQTAVRFADGDVYTQRCLSCDRTNGGRIVGLGLPPLPERPDPCVWCGSAEMVWEKV